MSKQDSQPAADSKPSPPSLPTLFRRQFLLAGILGGIVIFLDQLTKWLVLKNWPQPNFIYKEIIPGFFSLVHFQNRGAAWGIFAQHTWLLGCLSACAAIAIIVFFRQLTEQKKPLCLAFGFLWGGIVGNMYDRFFRPGVIDFLYFYYKDWSYPAFNVADISITCSVFFIVIYNLFCRKHSLPRP